MSLVKALESKNINSIKELIKSDCKFEKKDIDNSIRFLCNFIGNQDNFTGDQIIEIIEILSHKIDFSKTNLVHDAITFSYDYKLKKIAKFLFENKFDFSRFPDLLVEYLRDFCKQKDIEIVKILFEAKIDINHIGFNGNTVFTAYFCENDYLCLNIVKLLLSKSKQDLLYTTTNFLPHYDALTALYANAEVWEDELCLVVQKKQITIAEMLVNAGYDLEQREIYLNGFFNNNAGKHITKWIKQKLSKKVFEKTIASGLISSDSPFYNFLAEGVCEPQSLLHIGNFL